MRTVLSGVGGPAGIRGVGGIPGRNHTVLDAGGHGSVDSRGEERMWEITGRLLASYCYGRHIGMSRGKALVRALDLERLRGCLQMVQELAERDRVRWSQ
jgi:hypothetical protein